MFEGTHLIKDDKLVPAGDFIYQTYKKFGDYTYQETLNRDPFVDRYQLSDTSMYVLVVPDEIDRKENYTLNLGNVDSAYLYHPRAGQDNFDIDTVKVTNGQLVVQVTETPTFVQGFKADSTQNASYSGSLLNKQTSNKQLTMDAFKLKEVSVVYPNPATDVLNLKPGTIDSKKTLDVSIFSLSGVSVKKVLLLPGDLSIDIRDLPDGMYLIRVRDSKTAESILITKFVKQ
jgi:hypothetical protein